MPDLMTELQVGDRVRVIASNNPGIELGSKGTVLVSQGDRTEIRVDGSLEDWLFATEQLEKIDPIVRHAGTGEIERTRALYGIKFVRSGTPEELLEVQGHLCGMINEGWTYLFMERYLMTHGYQPNLIRRAFTNLTGLKAEDVVNEPWVRSPGCIPQLTHGWGLAKQGKGVYFIMPITDKYCVFCQEDDQHRVEVSKHTELLEAKDACRKLVGKFMEWNPPVKDAKREDVDVTQMYRQPQMFMHAAQVNALMPKLLALPSTGLRRSVITAALGSGDLSKPAYDILMRRFGDKEEDAQKEAIVERLKDLEKDEMQRPIQDDTAERTPQDFFDNEQMRQQYKTVPADVVDAVSRYLGKAGSELKDFHVIMRSFKYLPLEPSGQAAKSDEPDFMNATVSVAVLLDVFDKSLPKGSNRKPAGMVFSVIGNEIHTSDTLKGDDQAVYALSDEGLAKYFQRERGTSRG